MTVTSWSIPGAAGEPILGDTHQPKEDARGVIIIAHGFKGYKDYGMFPRIARVAAEHGFIAHRFNFSHSGMTNNVETFERPDLFEHDTWNRQVQDLRVVVDAVSNGELAGRGLPYLLFGHSRGGASVLLTAGRFADDESFPRPAGVVVASTPSKTMNLADADRAALIEQGYLESPSSRTGQVLRISDDWLREAESDPDGHDLLLQTERIGCPILVIHGDADPTVPIECADHIARAATDARVVRVADADHVFNTSNPMREEREASPQLRRLLDELVGFAAQCCTTHDDRHPVSP